MSESLTSWIQVNLTTLYESSSNTPGTQLDQSFDTTFSSTVEAFINHVPTTRDALKQSILERGFAATRVVLEWKDLIEVSEEDSPPEAGIVAGSFVVTRSLKFRIRAAPAQTSNQTIFSAKIVQDPSIHDGDQRRIAQIFITSIDKAAAIRLQSLPDT